MAYLCLDIGGTATRGALFDADGTVLARAETPAGALSLGVERTQAAIGETWQAIQSTLGGSGADRAPVELVAGLAGIGLRDRVDALLDRIDGFSRIRFVGDGYGALLDATGGQPGALIAVGTGVAGMRLMEDGTSRTMSGWGFPAGDLGSGAWIGLNAVSRLTRHLDGSPDVLSSALAEHILDITGRLPGAIMTWHMTAKPGDFARLAPAVVAAAESGDPHAEDILAAAAAEIADVALCLYDRRPGTVHLSGGLGGPLSSYCARVAPNFGWQVRQTDPLAGLYLLASGQAPDERLLPRPGCAVADY